MKNVSIFFKKSIAKLLTIGCNHIMVNVFKMNLQNSIHSVNKFLLSLHCRMMEFRYIRVE